MGKTPPYRHRRKARYNALYSVYVLRFEIPSLGVVAKGGVEMREILI